MKIIATGIYLCVSNAFLSEADLGGIGGHPRKQHWEGEEI